MSNLTNYRKTDESQGIKDQISNYSNPLPKSYTPSQPLQPIPSTFPSNQQEHIRPQELPLSHPNEIPISQLDISKFLPQKQPETFYTQEQVPPHLLTFGDKEKISDPFEQKERIKTGDLGREVLREKKDQVEPEKERLLNEKNENTEGKDVKKEGTAPVLSEEERIKAEEEAKRKINHFIERTKDLLHEAERKMAQKYAEAREAVSNIHLDETKAHLSHAYEATKEKVENIAESIMNSTKEELGLAKMAIEYTYENLKEGLGNFSGKVTETTKHNYEIAKDKLTDLSHKIPEEYGHTKDKASEISHKAMEMYEATKEKIIHASEELIDKTKDFLKPTTRTEPLDETLPKEKSTEAQEFKKEETVTQAERPQIVKKEI